MSTPVRMHKPVMTTSFILLIPLTLASNIFVQLDTMPGWLQAIVGRNPVTHLANASPVAMRMYRKEG